MFDLKLEQNEHIILRNKVAWINDRDTQHNLDGLFLTNKHLISVYEKSVALFLKGEPIVDKKPLSLISISDDDIQVENCLDSEDEESIHIMYNDGMEYWYLLEEDAPKSKYQQWESAIKKAVAENNRTTVKESRGQPINGTL